VLKSRFGAQSDRIVQRVLPFLARLRVQPDTLTLLGVAFSAAAAVAFGLGQTFVAAFALGFAGLCDLIDGALARAKGASSLAGAFLDSSMDRLSDLLILGGIAFGMAAAGNLGGLALVLWALAGTIMTSYTRARAERHLAEFDLGVMERGERFVVLILGALLGFLTLALWVVAIGATVTSVQRLVAARRLLLELERTGVDPTATPDEAEPRAAEPTPIRREV
jgi:CDP-diacylglycerol--glycerol-3-phosphate 3-phosphatidyltransferase